MTQSETVTLDVTVIDSADLANIGCREIADEVVAVGGKPDDAGTLPEKVRISGELTIEPAFDRTEVRWYCPRCGKSWWGEENDPTTCSDGHEETGVHWRRETRNRS